MDREAEIISKYLAENFNSEMMTARTGDPTPDVAASSKAGSSRIRVFHQVLFQFKPEVTAEQKKVLLESGKKMLESVPEISTLFQRKSPADVKAILESFLNPSDGPMVDDIGVSSVDDAIKELSA